MPVPTRFKDIAGFSGSELPSFGSTNWRNCAVVRQVRPPGLLPGQRLKASNGFCSREHMLQFNNSFFRDISLLMPPRQQQAAVWMYSSSLVGTRLPSPGLSPINNVLLYDVQYVRQLKRVRVHQAKKSKSICKMCWSLFFDSTCPSLLPVGAFTWLTQVCRGELHQLQLVLQLSLVLPCLLLPHCQCLALTLTLTCSFKKEWIQ